MFNIDVAYHKRRLHYHAETDPCAFEGGWSVADVSTQSVAESCRVSCQSVAQNAVQQNDRVGIWVVIYFLNQIWKAPAVALVFCMLVSDCDPCDSILYFTSEKTW